MSLYREIEQQKTRLAELHQNDLQARQQVEDKRREEQGKPKMLLHKALVDALSSSEAVVVVAAGGLKRHEIGSGHIASGQVFYVEERRLTRRELWYADTNGKVALTASADGVFEGEEGFVDRTNIQRRTLRLDDVLTNQRLVFPGGFLHLPGNPNNGRIEKLEGNRWQTVVIGRQQTPESQQLLEHFVGLWEGKGKPVPVRLR